MPASNLSPFSLQHPHTFWLFTRLSKGMSYIFLRWHWLLWLSSYKLRCKLSLWEASLRDALPFLQDSSPLSSHIALYGEVHKGQQWVLASWHWLCCVWVAPCATPHQCPALCWWPCRHHPVTEKVPCLFSLWHQKADSWQDCCRGIGCCSLNPLLFIALVRRRRFFLF